MTAEREIMISGRVYRKNPEVDRYQIHLDDLGDLRMRDIPPHSHLEILGLPEPKGVVNMECYGLNEGDEGDHEYLEVYGGATFRVGADERSEILSRLRYAFPDMDPEGQEMVRNPYITAKPTDNGILANVSLNLKYKDKPETLVRDAVAPFVEGFRRMDIELDAESDEFEFDANKPLVLLLGNIDHEGVQSSLSASRRQYKKKLLESTSRNWDTIVNYFKQYPVAAVLIKLTPHTFRLLASSDYEFVRDELFSRIASVPNAVFVYEDVLTGKKQDEWQEEHRPYPSRDIVERVLNWLEPYGIELIPYRTNAEVTVLAESFLLDTEKNLIFRLYIPTGRIWSNEADRFLQLFRDYLERVGHLTVRLDQRRTNQGTIYAFHGDETQRDARLQDKFEDFSQFMELCTSDTAAAEAFLEAREIHHREVIDIVARYSKEAKRLQVDLKHEGERKILAIRQRLESELVDVSPTREDWNAINLLVDLAIPLLKESSSFSFLNQTLLLPEGKSTNSPITINVRPQIIQSVNGIVGQEIYGNQYLTQEDQQLLALIKEHGGIKSRELESALHELADNSAPQPNRLGARQKIKKFLIEVGKRTSDVAVGVLQTYIEKKLGL